MTSAASAPINPASRSARREPPVPPYAIGWTVKGTYNKTPCRAAARWAACWRCRTSNRPFPVQADVKVGDSARRASSARSPIRPISPRVDMRLWLQGISMAHLYSLTGVTLPDTPPYATEGRLVGQFKRSGNVFKYENFTGRVGGSDLNGSLTYTAREPRPLLQGELVSNLLQFSDLAPVIGADSNASKAKRGDATMQPSNKVLPVEEFRTDRWKAIDADVKFTGRRIIKNPDLPITDLYTHVVMTDGVLSLVPLSFGVAGGTLSSDIHLDGSTTPLEGPFLDLGAPSEAQAIVPELQDDAKRTRRSQRRCRALRNRQFAGGAGGDVERRSQGARHRRHGEPPADGSGGPERGERGLRKAVRHG